MFTLVPIMVSSSPLVFRFPYCLRHFHQMLKGLSHHMLPCLFHTGKHLTKTAKLCLELIYMYGLFQLLRLTGQTHLRLADERRTREELVLHVHQCSSPPPCPALVWYLPVTSLLGICTHTPQTYVCLMSGVNSVSVLDLWLQKDLPEHRD